MIDLGDYKVGAIVYCPLNTNAATGASITRATNGTVNVYKNAVTSPDTSGVTDAEDFASNTGVHLISIDTSSDAVFYTAAGHFTIVITGAVIDGETVNNAVGFFTLEKRSQWDLVRADHDTAGTFGEVLEADDIADVVLDDARFTAVQAAVDALDPVELADVVEGTVTIHHAMKIMLAALAGKASGLNTTTATYRNIPDDKDRIVATVDADGNRTAVTLDVT